MALFQNVDPEIKRVADALRPAMEKLDVRPEVTFPGGATLTIGYKTQRFKVHGRSMTGEIAAVAHDEVGPSFRGFVLSASLQKRGEVNQAVTPQTLQEPYWRTDLDVTPLAGTSKQLFWSLSYGVRTDAAVLMQLRHILRGLATTPH